MKVFLKTVCQRSGNVPCSLEYTQQPGASQDADTERRHDAAVVEDRFDDTAQHDETVETIEQRHEVALQAETVHLEQHLHREQPDEAQVRELCQRQQLAHAVNHRPTSTSCSN